jgi:hypothetical protein
MSIWGRLGFNVVSPVVGKLRWDYKLDEVGQLFFVGRQIDAANQAEKEAIEKTREQGNDVARVAAWDGREREVVAYNVEVM